jgi:hypothetical protein
MTQRTHISFLSAIAILTVMLCAKIAYSDLLIFRATEDKQVYERNSGKYERIVVLLPLTREPKEVYIETKPVLKIPAEGIKSVIIQKEQAQGRPSKSKAAVDYMYTATFELNEQAAKEFINFSNKHDGELIDLRLGNKTRLGLGRVVKKFIVAGNNFTVGLEEINADRLKEIFSPLKGKVTWE